MREQELDDDDLLKPFDDTNRLRSLLELLLQDWIEYCLGLVTAPQKWYRHALVTGVFQKKIWVFQNAWLAIGATLEVIIMGRVLGSLGPQMWARRINTWVYF